MLRSLCTALALLAALGVAPASAAVHYADGRITAHLEGADLIDVLRDVAGQARLAIRGAPVAPQPVSVELEAVPLAEALPRLLAGQSFLLTYAGERVKGIRFLGSSDSLGFAAPAEPAVAPEAPPLEESGSLAASHRLVPIGGRLARAVGADHTSFSDIMGVAMWNPDSRVRVDALRVGLRIIDDEPELGAAVVGVLDGLQDDALVAWLERVAGEYAREIARRAAKSSRTGALRERAAAVERLLEAKSDAPRG